MRLKWDQAMKEVFWKSPSNAVCRTDDMSRTFLAALAPAHRLRLLSLVSRLPGGCRQKSSKAASPAILVVAPSRQRVHLFACLAHTTPHQLPALSALPPHCRLPWSACPRLTITSRQ